MKKIPCLLLGLLYCLAALGAPAPVRLISEPWPPYIIDEKGHARGLAHDITVQVLARMGYETTYQSYPWKRVVLMIDRGMADAVIGISRNAEREGKMIFPDEPLMTATELVFYQRGSDFVYRDISSLKGKRVGVIAGYYYNEKIAAAENFHLIEARSLKENVDKLLQGGIDLFIEERAVGRYWLSQHRLQDQVAYSEKSLTDEVDHYVAFSKKPGNASLARRFSLALAEFKLSEAYRAILREYAQD